MAQKRSIEIQADSVGKTACPKCGSVVASGGAPAFSGLQCPKCKVKFSAPGKLGGFVLLKELGRGQMGVTYKAYEKMLGRYVAIKVMRASLGNDPKRVKEFMAEGRALASLDHPNAVRIYSIGQEKGQPYIAMELVNGHSVGHVMGRQKRLEEARALEIATGVARALRAAGDIGLIHSDVKPDNIVLDEKGRAKLVDFGIARFGPGKLEADAAIGTPYYVAPEQVLRASVDLRTDIYSLGATLYHMIAGKPPFPGTELEVVLNSRLKKSAPSLMKTRRDLHMETVHVVAKMLQKNPDRRYQDYEELLKDLRRACWASGAELTQDADDAPLEMAPRGKGSSMGKVLMAAVVLLCLGGVGVWAMFFRGAAPVADPTDVRAVDPEQVADLVFYPKPGKIAGPTKVTASCDTPEAEIYYTTDGAVPTRKSKRWRGAIEVVPDTKLRVRAFHADLKPSETRDIVYKADSIVVGSVVRVRSEAKAAWLALQKQKHDRGQGFGKLLDRCGRTREQADELYEKLVYAEAMTLYKNLQVQCKHLQTLESQRKTAKIAWTRAGIAIKTIPDFGTLDKPAEEWKTVAATALQARATFERGEFVKAYGLWGRIAGRINQQYQSELPKVRAEYETALKAHDAGLLSQYGGQAWRNVRDAIKQAADAETKKQFGRAVMLYRQAKDGLAQAVLAAKKASDGEVKKKSIAKIKDLIQKGQYYQAQKLLAPIIKTAPNDGELLKYKKAINDAVEVKFYLKSDAKDEKGGLVMRLRLVTPGVFKMGSPKTQPGRGNSETLHDVEITKPFYMGKFEVTRSQFEYFTKAANYKTAPEKKKGMFCTALSRGRLIKISGVSWRNPGFVQGPDHPAVCVSWDDAMAFCNWLSKRTGGMTVTLPTEAQWEYACRQGSDKRFSFGDDSTKLCEYGNYADGSSAFAALSGDVRNSDSNATTSPVGTYKSAPLRPRFFDMHGNAAEWCLDWFGPYATGSGGKPSVNPTGIVRGAKRVVRGGAWASAPAKCRSAARWRMAGTSHSAVIGFRVVAFGKPPGEAAARKAAGVKPLTGRIGVGTWETSAEFRGLRVMRNKKRIFAFEDEKRQKHKGAVGKWGFKGPVMRQGDLGPNRFVLFGEPAWSNYTINVKARKISGKEGFLVRFADDGRGQFYVFNAGGRGNKSHSIEKFVKNKPAGSIDPKPGSVKGGHWYDIKIELVDTVARCYLDNKLICTLDTSTSSK